MVSDALEKFQFCDIKNYVGRGEPGKGESIGMSAQQLTCGSQSAQEQSWSAMQHSQMKMKQIVQNLVKFVIHEAGVNVAMCIYLHLFPSFISACTVDIRLTAALEAASERRLTVGIFSGGGELGCNLLARCVQVILVAECICAGSLLQDLP